jgi:hypothetical protein
LQTQQQKKLSTPSSTFENTYDYDPILARIQALSTMTVANAKTEAEQARRKLIIDTGDPTVAKTLGFDENTISAATQNPESMLAQLNKEFAKRQLDLKESYSAQNLLYSGSYADELKNLATGRASAEASVGQKLRDALAGVDSGLLASQEAERQRLLQAAQDAAMKRAGLESGYGGASAGNLADFKYDAVVPPGYSLEAIYAQAQANAPAGQTPMHIMNQGQIIMQNGVPGVMIKYFDPNTGTGNTIWVPLPTAPPTTPTPTPPPINVVTGEPDPTVRSRGIAQLPPDILTALASGGGRSAAI